MYVLVTYLYKNEEDQMKNEWTRMVKNIIELYFRHSRTASYSCWSSVAENQPH